MGDKVPRFPEPSATPKEGVEASAPLPGFQRLKPNSFLLLGMMGDAVMGDKTVGNKVGGNKVVGEKSMTGDKTKWRETK